MRDAWSPDRVGIRISPTGAFNGLEDPDGDVAGLALARELSSRGLAFLHLSEPDWAGGPPLDDAFRDELRASYAGVIVGAGAYDKDKAEQMLQRGWIDAAAFGRTFIANPDLPRRLEGRCRSTSRTGRPSTAAARPGTSTTRRTRAPEAYCVAHRRCGRLG